MNIHEYQAKELLKRFGVPVLNGQLATTADEAVAATRELGGSVWVVKAQVHTGGRGKGGGIKVANSPEEVRSLSENMLGMNLVTHQTGPEGKKVSKLYIEEGCNIAREVYLAALLDRNTSRVTMMASSEGGVEIEEVAAKNPEKIHRVSIDPAVGMQPFQARQLAFALNLEGKAVKQATKFFMKLYTVFVELDCSLAEINPLVLTKEDDVIALDCKMNFDSNALYRHPDIVELRDIQEEDPAEAEAAEHDLAFIKLDGDIGCMVNGAGLAMATMDIIKLSGGNPANFLDVGGGASKEKVTEAFKIILRDPNVKGILVNIFGGIMKCDVIAEGVLAASADVGLKVPLVVRLQGTNVEKGKEILASSDLNIIAADDLSDAAEKIVSAVKGAQ